MNNESRNKLRNFIMDVPEHLVNVMAAIVLSPVIITIFIWDFMENTFYEK